MEQIDYSSLPEHIRDGFKAYIEGGLLLSSFIYAVLCNDLRESFARADDFNRLRMFDIVSFMYNQAPARCWGSKKEVGAWMAEFKKGTDETRHQNSPGRDSVQAPE